MCWAGLHVSTPTQLAAPKKKTSTWRYDIALQSIGWMELLYSFHWVLFDPLMQLSWSLSRSSHVSLGWQRTWPCTTDRLVNYKRATNKHNALMSSTAIYNNASAHTLLAIDFVLCITAYLPLQILHQAKYHQLTGNSRWRGYRISDATTPATGEENLFRYCGTCKAHTRLVTVHSFTWLSKPRWTRLCDTCFSGALAKRSTNRLTVTETEPSSRALPYPPPLKTCGCIEEFSSLLWETESNGHKVSSVPSVLGSRCSVSSVSGLMGWVRYAGRVSGVAIDVGNDSMAVSGSWTGGSVEFMRSLLVVSRWKG